MTYSDFRHLLFSKRDELSRRLDGIQSDFAKGRSANFNDQAQERENDDVLMSLRVEANQELMEVNNAILRIDSGQFGVCSVCGEPIEENRLRAIPYTQRCMRCAQ